MGAPPREYGSPLLSPDGGRIATGIGGDVWVYDLSRDTLTRLTFDGGTNAHWSEDGKRVLYGSAKGGRPTNLFWKPADGSGPEERLTSSEYQQTGGSFSSDGRWLIFAEIHPDTARDTWAVPMEGHPGQAGAGRKPQLILQTKFEEGGTRFSPDGRWIAYTSNESGRTEVYVQLFPGPGGKWQISTGGGNEVAWNRNGRELFYRTGNKMMAVDVTTQPTFTAGKPRVLFEGRYISGATYAVSYDVSPDGQRFLMLKAIEQQETSLTQINVVLNWFEELRRRVPVKQ